MEIHEIGKVTFVLRHIPSIRMAGRARRFAWWKGIVVRKEAVGS